MGTAVRTDRVILDVKVIEKFRKKEALSKTGLYQRFGMHGSTGLRILNKKTVTLSLANKVAQVIGVPVQDLIVNWVD